MDSERIIRNLKRQLLIERIALAAIALTLTTTWAIGHLKSGKSLILVDGKPVACLLSRSDAEVVLGQIKTDTGCNPSEIQFQQDVRVARAPREAEPVSRHKALAALRDVVCPLVPRWAIIVNGKPVVALPDQKTAGDALELARTKYGSLVANLAEEPQFKEEVTVDYAPVPANLFRKTAEDAVNVLLTDTPSKVSNAIYTVRNGDMAVSIASRNGLTLSELEALNPGINLARLQIGDTLHIKAAKGGGPKLTVVVRDQSEQVERIPAPVQRVSSAQLYVGNSTVLSPGQAGERRVKVATVYENGRRTGSEILSEEILREPSPRRIAMGIKHKR